MKDKKSVVLIFRKFRKGRYSMETLFNPIIEENKELNKIELPYELNSLYNLIKLFVFSIKIKEEIIHITGDVNFIAFFLFWKKIIITVHDLNHYEELKGLKKYLYGLIWFKYPLLFSNKIVVISPFVKKQLITYFKIDSEKISIIPNTFVPIKQQRMFFRDKNSFFEILIIGTKYNKNISRLIYSIKKIPNIKLNIVGEIDRGLKEILLSNKVEYDSFFNISREKLDYLYLKSNMLYFASIKEGFGLPILEAQSAYLPVLTSETTSMPYVAGGGAVIVNPFDLESIRNGVLRIKLNDLNIRLLLDTGYKNLERFSFDKFQLNYYSIYKELI